MTKTSAFLLLTLTILLPNLVMGQNNGIVIYKTIDSFQSLNPDDSLESYSKARRKEIALFNKNQLDKAQAIVDSLNNADFHCYEYYLMQNNNTQDIPSLVDRLGCGQPIPDELRYFELDLKIVKCRRSRIFNRSSGFVLCEEDYYRD